MNFPCSAAIPWKLLVFGILSETLTAPLLDTRVLNLHLCHSSGSTLYCAFLFVNLSVSVVFVGSLVSCR